MSSLIHPIGIKPSIFRSSGSRVILRKAKLIFFLFCLKPEPLFYEVAHNVAQPDAQGKGKSHDNASKDNKEADGYDCVANTYVLKNNPKSDNNKENSDTFCNKISVSYVRILTEARILTRQVNNPADKIAENNPDDDNNN